MAEHDHNPPQQDPRYDLFGPYEKLIEVRVLGSKFLVPENNKLLRCFQYLSLLGIANGRFCWNGDCKTCQVRYRTHPQADERSALSCQVPVAEGMHITELSEELSLRLRDVLASAGK
ncbi:MAG: (2Fe-2S)-binding protein [Acidobacteria bacterium]|nr:(2Fe-2S)-binding protein [Acidobacteriota bacterium]